jgi:hypothetical protein
LDLAAPIGPEELDARYEAVVAVTDEARSRMLSQNPFAEKLSGLAMEGIHKLHRQLLGQVDELGNAIEDFGKEDVRPPTSQSQVLRSTTPAVTGAEAPEPKAAPLGADNPFTSRSLDGDGQTTSPLPLQPQAASDTDAIYADSRSGTTYRIPSGHALYRSPATGRLAVMPEAEIPSSAEDDRVENGQVRCSRSGTGRVLPECEKRRRRENPFEPR